MCQHDFIPCRACRLPAAGAAEDVPLSPAWYPPYYAQLLSQQLRSMARLLARKLRGQAQQQQLEQQQENVMQRMQEELLLHCTTDAPDQQQQGEEQQQQEEESPLQGQAAPAGQVLVLQQRDLLECWQLAMSKRCGCLAGFPLMHACKHLPWFGYHLHAVA
jgi:hypothetical protein